VSDTLPPPPAGKAEIEPREKSEPLRLVVSSADTMRSIRLVPGSTLRVGRINDNDIVIAHDTVSRLHALLHVDGERVIVEDAGSRNGIRFNGDVVPSGKPISLEPGAVVQIGPATLFLVEKLTSRVSISQRDSVGMRAAKAIAAPPRPVAAGAAPMLVLKDESMTLLYQSAETIASSAMSVLILGETGVGKELLASSIHSMSPRRAKPFVTFNSAALPESLVESELFGYARGAFTGADRSKPGLFEAADGGTLFLDEVADLSLQAQAKLLRVIETGEVLSVGGVKPRTVDVRVVSATNSDLYALMAAGRFRKDLYYRLSGATLHIPALRQRPADIPALVDHFAARYAASAQVPKPEFHPDTIAALQAHPWPGNVRELKNAVQRAAVMVRGRPILVADLQLREGTGQVPNLAVESATSVSGHHITDASSTWRRMSPDSTAEVESKAELLRQELAKEERARIVEALDRAHGNQVVAARILGVSRRTLVNRLNTYDIPRPRKGQH
jgi:DNA-binding NtrC family response regulator